MKILSLPDAVEFDWDEGNSEKNVIKHNVSVKECEEVFSDQPVYAFDSRHSSIEQRWGVHGSTAKERKLFIVMTVRSKKIRVISARDMDRREREAYEEKIKNYP